MYIRNIQTLVEIVFISSFIVLIGLLGFTIQTASAQTVTATLERQLGDGPWNTENALINYGDQVKLRWSSTGADSCEATGSGFSTGSGNPTSGTDSSINEPSSGNSITYTVSCTGAGGVDSDSITVNVTEKGGEIAPTVTLKRKYKGEWNSDDVVGDMGGGVAFRWESTYAQYCNATGFSFNTNQKTHGTDWFITEPTIGNSETYTVTCTGAGGVVSDSITVTNQPTPTVTLEQKYKGVWSTEDVTILVGDRVDLKWNSTYVDSCSATSGSGFGTGDNTNGYDWFIDEPTEGNSETFTVTCTGPSGTVSDSITITAVGLPTVTLESRINREVGNMLWEEGTWSDSSTVDMRDGDDIDLRWNSTNTNICQATSGNGFSTGGETSGHDYTIDNPNTKYNTYTVTCTGWGGSTASDSVLIVVK